MSDFQSVISVVQLVSSLLVVPMFNAVWQMNARIANIEGVLHGLEKNAGSK